MSRRGDFASVLRAARRAGCTVERTGKHVVLRTPRGSRAAYVAAVLAADPRRKR